MSEDPDSSASSAQVRRRSFKVTGLVVILNIVFAIAVGFVTTTANPPVCETTTLTPPTSTSAGAAPSAEFTERTCKPSFDAASTILISILALAVITLVELAFDVRASLALRRKESELWELDDEFTRHIHNILANARAITAASYGPDDRYVRYFRDELVGLENRTREAAQSQDLVVENDEFQLAADIDGAFRDGSTRIFRHTWPISTAGEVFTTAGWRYFFDLLFRMATEKRLEVHTILVIEDVDLLASPNLIRLLQFYESTSRMVARVVLRADFADIAVQNRVPADQVDFGVYDNSLLYVTEGATGRFTKNEHRIATFVRLFTTMWDSGGVTVSLEGKVPEGKILIQRLFELDGQA